jgi:tricorn protease-like protein
MLERLEPDGSTRRLTSPLAELIPDAPSLSPDGRWVAVEGDTGCAASYVYVAPAAGGAARLVYGRSPTEPFASNYSSLLGWSADGRLVVLFEPPHCDTTPPGPPPRGVYLVDPRTLTRTFVTASAVAMWGSAARG